MALNKFLEFNEQKNEMQTDEQYSADTQRIGGLQTGLARTVFHNKLFRQASVMVSALGKVVADLGKNADDTSRDTLAQNIKDTMLSAENHVLSTETQALYNTANVDDALKKMYADINLTASLSAYGAFCTNANANSLDSAFGKNRLDSEVRGLGIALALYAYFNGDSRITHPFTELKTVNNLTELINNPTALAELYYCDNLFALTELSPYAKGILDATNIYPIIVASAGVSNPLSFTTADSIATNDIAVNSISSSVRALYITGKVVRLRPIWSNATFVSKMFSKTAFIDNIFEAPLTAIYEPLMTSISAINTYIVSKRVSEVVASQVTKVLANNKAWFISITAGGGVNAGSGVIVGYFPVGTSTQTRTVGSGTQVTVAVNKLASTPYISNLSGSGHTSNTQWTNFPIPL